MILKIVNEIEKCIEAELYVAALTLAVTIPDSCSKFDFPDIKSSGDRYIKFVSNFMDKYDNPNNSIKAKESQKNYLHFGAKDLYRLRCTLLHESNPLGSMIGVDKFILFADKEGVSAYSSISESTFNNDIKKHVTYSINIIDLTSRLCAQATSAYERHEEEFDKIDYFIGTNFLGI